MKKVLLSCIILGMTGCATVVDRDFEKEEAEFIKAHGKPADDPFYAPSTPDDVLAGKEDGVRITLHKIRPTVREGLSLQNWTAVLTNTNDEPKCVATIWKLMDFEMETPYPESTYIGANEQKIDYAFMRQVVWDIEGTKFALPPSGYIEKLFVVDPKKDAKPGEECLFEPEVQEPVEK